MHFAAPLRLGGRKCGKGHAVARDCHLLAAFNPLCYLCEVIPQVAHGCRLHCDTSMSHNVLQVNGSLPPWPPWTPCDDSSPPFAVHRSPFAVHRSPESP